MEFHTVVRENHGIGPPEFSKAVNIWCRNPQTVNRRILASVCILDTVLNGDAFDILRRILALDVSCLVPGEEKEDADIEWLVQTVRSLGQGTPDSTDGETRLYAAKQLPRVPHIFSAGIDFFLFDGAGNRAINVHKPLSAHKQPLGLRTACMLEQTADGYTSLSVHRQDVACDPSIEWMEKRLFPRILKWAGNDSNGTASPRLTSLSLVSAEKYADLYCKLKDKYGAKLTSNWPENTDPTKFVYEDIAIAAYLLLLWEKERSERKSNDLQSFLDLGCGNGLLVYILFNEGHRGTGIDLRKRKIWDLYPAGTPLEVRAVVPSSGTVYPGVDWIIGNHSDELTPWIPIIAARSSDDCRFFLLPCCPYDLNGTKYQRRSADKSQYSDYIEYVERLCVRCGFRTYMDKLRIPSTKRICLIGWDRPDGEIRNREDRIREILREKTTFTRRDSVEGWSCLFTPRDAVERVRNCTQLDKSLLKEIVDIVSGQLLHEGRTIWTAGSSTKRWNAGRCLELREVFDSIPRELTARLRNECGGLQTLLKNHGHVFRVAGGKVEFRVPGETVEARPRKKRGTSSMPRTKSKVCWFFENHPDGCPASDAACSYEHR